MKNLGFSPVTDKMAKLHSVLNHLLSSNKNWLSAFTTIEEIA